MQFRFLGILMAVAIRTKKPLDLHLAPWVWKQLCSIPLGGGDLEEVDLLTYRSLQGILHLDNSGITEENFTVVRTGRLLDLGWGVLLALPLDASFRLALSLIHTQRGG